MFSTFPRRSPGSGSEDSELSNKSPPTFQDVTQPPLEQKMFLGDPSCTWDLQRSKDLAIKLLATTESLSEVQQQEVAKFNRSVPPPGFVGSTNPRFKTEFCRNFKEKGSCFYGDYCQFAHGPEEIRLVEAASSVGHRQYRTKLCQKYWFRGYCSYGPRCNFIHGLNKMSNSDLESRLPPDNLLGQGTESRGAISFSSSSRDLAFFFPSYNPEKAPTKKPGVLLPIGSGRPSDKDKKPGL